MRPAQYITRLSLFSVAILCLVAALFPTLSTIFMHNAPLNGLIIFILLFGAVRSFKLVTDLTPATRWLHEFGKTGLIPAKPPKLLTTFSYILGSHLKTDLQGHPYLSAQVTETLLENASGRLSENKGLSRYLVGTLVFLGLLGTFWGLLHVIDSISGVIAGLGTVSGSNVGVMFENLKQGLAQPLDGMSIAFGSSLFGLACALVLGFMDITVGQAYNRFYNHVEEQLAKLTTEDALLAAGSKESASSSATSPIMAEILAEKLEVSLRDSFASLNASFSRNTEALQLFLKDYLTLEQKKDEESSARTLAFLEILHNLQQDKEIQDDQNALLTGITEKVLAGINAQENTLNVIKAHAGNIETGIQRLLAENIQASNELRNDIRLLVRALVTSPGNKG